MEKIYKRVPFDLELAKKITNGEVEGRIVCFYALEYNTTRIICWDRKPSYPIVALVEINPTDESVFFFSLKGESCNNYAKLFIELPEETPKTQAELCEEAWLEDKKKGEFKPFDKVLVRDDCDMSSWKPSLFVKHYPCAMDGKEYFETIGEHFYELCIPYEGNEHLVGTTDIP